MRDAALAALAEHQQRLVFGALHQRPRRRAGSTSTSAEPVAPGGLLVARGARQVAGHGMALAELGELAA